VTVAEPKPEGSTARNGAEPTEQVLSAPSGAEEAAPTPTRRRTVRRRATAETEPDAIASANGTPAVAAEAAMANGTAPEAAAAAPRRRTTRRRAEPEA
jgi:hypothetical protein